MSDTKNKITALEEADKLLGNKYVMLGAGATLGGAALSATDIPEISRGGKIVSIMGLAGVLYGIYQVTKPGKKGKGKGKSKVGGAVNAPPTPKQVANAKKENRALPVVRLESVIDVRGQIIEPSYRTYDFYYEESSFGMLGGVHFHVPSGSLSVPGGRIVGILLNGEVPQHYNTGQVTLGATTYNWAEVYAIPHDSKISFKLDVGHFQLPEPFVAAYRAWTPDRTARYLKCTNGTKDSFRDPEGGECQPCCSGNTANIITCCHYTVTLPNTAGHTPLEYFQKYFSANNSIEDNQGCC